MTSAGQVSVEARLSLDKLIADARKAQDALQKALKDIELSVDVDAHGITKTTKQFNDLDKQVEKTKKSTEDFNSILAGISAGVTSKGLDILLDTLSTIPNFVADATLEFEKFRTVLTTLLGSSRAADQALDGLREFAATTPFELNEVTGAFIKLKQRGIEPTKEVLTSLGDLASSQGKSLDQVTEAILDATTGEFERLKEFGIRASSQGDKVKLSFKGVNVEVAKTPEAIQQAITGFGKLDGVAGGMDALSQTLGGQLSNLQDNLSRAAVAFGNELLPVLLEFVEGLNTGGGDLETFARELGQNIAPILQLIANSLKFAADNGEILATIVQVLTARFLALKAVALAGTIQQAAIAAGVLTVGANGAAVSLGGLAVAGKAAALSLGTLLIQLAAITAAIEGIKFAKFANDLAGANTAIDGLEESITASSGAALSAAERTKKAVDELTAAKQSGRALTQQEITDSRKLVKANEERLNQLNDQLKAAQALPAADEAQKNARQALIAQTQTSINSLKKQNDALNTLTTTTQNNTTATQDERSAYEKLSDAYDSQLSSLENALKSRQTTIATNAKSEDDLREQSLKAEQDYLNQRIAINQSKLAELQQLQKSTTDKKELEKIGQEITSVESAIASDRLSIAQQGAQSRLDAARQGIEDQKATEEKAEQDRKAAQEKALADFERANENATRAVENSQNQRTAAIRQAQLAGVLTEEEAQSQIQQIQQDSIAETISAKQDEINRVNDLREQGVITAEEASDREAELTKELGQLKLDQIESELEAQRAARAEIIAGIEAEAQARSSKLQGQSGQLDLRGGSLQSELDLLNARNELATALGGLEQERLNTQIAIAEAAGNSEQVERLKEQQLRLQSQQLDRQYAAQKEQLKIQQELKKIELEREKLNAQIAVIEAEAALAKATAEGADSRELNALKEVLNLRRQQVGAIDDVIARQDELNNMQNQVVDVQYQTERERQRQARIQQQQPTTDTGTGTEARSTRPNYDPRTQFLGRDGRVYNRQNNASTSNASRLLQTPAIPADSPLKQPGISGQVQGATTAATLVSVVNLTEVTTRLDRIQGILASVGLRPNLSVSSPQPIADAARVYSEIASKAANI